jgi:hypothetical protein
VALASDADHCGDCENACAANELCIRGVCGNACPDDLKECNGACVDPRLDVRHCGECAHTCQPQQVCSEGRCKRACTEPLLDCDGLCRDTNSDSRHCGGCGTVCSALDSGVATVCVEGSCVPRDEDCTNGVDDNDDSLSDCEDPGCLEAVRCVPRSPAGWSEPFVLFTNEASSEVACEGPFDRVVISGLHQDLLSEPAQCSCECTTTARCAVNVWFYDDVA